MTHKHAAKPSSDPLEDPFAAALRRGVFQIGADGRLNAANARALRKAVRESRNADRSAFLHDPEAVFGPFEALPPDAQGAIVEALAEGDRWRLMAQNRLTWRAPLTRALRRASKTLPSWLGRPPRATAQVLALALQSGPSWGLHELSRRATGWSARFSRRPKLSSVFAAAGIEVRGLAVRYARGVPQRPPYRGFWHDPTRHTTVGLLVGVDLVKNADGYWFVESNMNCGLGRTRSLLFEEDPLPKSVVEFAAGNGYRRLIVVAGIVSVDPVTTGGYQQGAAKRNLALTILEDAYKPRYGHEQTIAVPSVEEAETLIVRNRHYRTNLDYVIHHKRASGRALRIYKQETGDTSFHLPTTSIEPFVGPTDPDDPFPNLVFKFPEDDGGQGVLFLKVSSLADAEEVLAETLRAQPRLNLMRRLFRSLSDRQGLFQTYVRTPWNSDRRLSKIRAYVLLTPVGVQFLAAHRMVCAYTVPASLPMGVVHDQRPYLVSWRKGIRLEVLRPDEFPAAREAALGVARGLAGALSYGFETGPHRSETTRTWRTEKRRTSSC